MEITEDVLCYDCETETFGLPDSEKDRLKFFGCYSYKTKKFYMITNKNDIQRVINSHKYLVGFNNKQYDNIILMREGIEIKYKHIIDLMEIFRKRAGGMKIKKGQLSDLLMSFSLDYITKTLDLVDEGSKLKIDFNLFKKNEWSIQELALIKEYLERDIMLTKKLYEWCEEYFESFKEFLTSQDVDKKLYLTVSIAKFAYKSICKAMGWNEEYANKEESESSIQGGYVAYPAGERFEDNIYCFDFASLYPHIMIQYNLYGRQKKSDERNIWSSTMWKTEGIYYSDVLSPVGQLLKKWYTDRLKYKKEGDRREYTIKIILNTIYGILNDPYYMLVHDSIAGGDCTRLGRQWIKFARKCFRDEGYKIIYTDTDSIYIQDLNKNKEKLFLIKDKIIKDILETVPFPQPTFNMILEAEIKYMYFFKGEEEDKESDKEMDEDDFINKHLQFMKKNYIYVTIDNKVVIKNLGIRKKSNSEVSKKIFWQYIVPKLKEGEYKFSKIYILGLIKEIIKQDITMALLRKEVGDIKSYANTTSLASQISKKYGSGIHFFLPNNKSFGVGKGKSFCTLEEFKQHNMKLEDIDYNGFVKELDYFIKPVITKNIFDFEK